MGLVNPDQVLLLHAAVVALAERFGAMGQVRLLVSALSVERQTES